ncbi:MULTISPECIES: helix-turn-helix transcriptional regulator [Pseudomonas]|uniref:helix-turn-helix transcriptional regulator n=1 Tax=Pseudomonas TaxID=286 RepID=UPI000A04CFEA|nr:MULTISPECIES: AraC family transcriptional regulator [Pseudomonas]PRA73070.1 AraC family transcriptional regulator [Pseudomonas sp. MYb187]
MQIVNHWPTNSFPQHRNRSSLCVSIINSAVQELDARGVDLQRLQADWGVSITTLRQPQLRLPAFLGRRFWEVARELSGDPAIGLAAARQNDPGQMLGLAYLMQMMPTRLASLQMLVRYWPLLAGHLALQCMERDGLLCVALVPNQELFPAIEEVDCWGALQVQHLKGLPGTRNAVCELRLRRSVPIDPSPWLRLPVGKIQFCAERDEVALDIEALQELRPTGSPAVCAALEDALERYAVDTLKPSILESVADMVLGSLAAGPDFEQTARHLHVASRTLHRALQREGWSFNAIVDTQRRYLAGDLIQAGELAVSEVAGRLGYREVSNFIRAFRRWYAVAPRAFSQSRVCSQY